MRFYALVLWRLRGRVLRRLQMLFLKDGRTLTHDPHLAELETVETKIARIWDEVEDCATAGEFVPRRSRLCDWCAFRTQCPPFSSIPPKIFFEFLIRRTFSDPANFLSESSFTK